MNPKGISDPFYLGDGETACLLIHGFAGTPSEVHWLGAELHKKGYAVQGILLPGHGTRPEHLAATTWQDWLQEAEQAFLELVRTHTRVFIVGVSMGGLLALMLGAKYPDRVAAVVTAGTPSARRFFKDRRIHLVPWVKHVMPYQQRKVPVAIKKLHQDRGRVYYTRRPLAAVHSLLKLVDRVGKVLPDVHCPVLVMHSLTDDVISPASAAYLYGRIPGTKRLKLVEESAHIITLDKEREIVLNCIDDFFREIMEKGDN